MLELSIYTAFSVTAVLLGVTTRQLVSAFRRFDPPKHRSPLGKEVDLPSVTVCIPARNEQHALAYCLEKVVASEYDKLEIIVLDDVSGDDTSALIKSFASEGVRFVQGKELPTGWLGKNHALQGLLEEASGTYVLFMDVDTRLAPMAIENMVRYAISHRTPMLSVLPRREDGWRMSVLFSPLRYFWEIVFGRKFSPASASNAWLIKRKVLTERFDGLSVFKNAIQPEAQIADALSLSNEYAFLVGTERFGVSYEKKWRSQLVTSIRLLFPLFGSRFSMMSIVIIGITLLLLPYIMLCTLIFVDFSPVHIVAIVIAAYSMALYGYYAHRVWKKGWLLAAILWPFLLLQEIALISTSYIQYVRNTVKWKGRLIRPEARN